MPNLTETAAGTPVTPDDDPQEDGCSGSTPPGHEQWISPLDKQKDLWLSHYTDTKVTDPQILARLEQDDPPEGDEASINRPVDFDKLDPELRKELEARIFKSVPLKEKLT